MFIRTCVKRWTPVHPPDRRTECTMADDTAGRDYQYRDRINIHEHCELRYWTKELGLTPEKLKWTVEKVGAMATEVRKARGKYSGVVVQA